MNPTLDHALALRPHEALPRDTRTVFQLLAQLRGGLLEVRLPNGSAVLFGDGESGVTLQVHDTAFFSRVLARGDIGFAEAYLDGQWDSPDLTALLTLLARNRDALAQAIYGSWRQLLTARWNVDTTVNRSMVSWSPETYTRSTRSPTRISEGLIESRIDITPIRVP